MGGAAAGEPIALDQRIARVDIDAGVAVSERAARFVQALSSGCYPGAV